MLIIFHSDANDAYEFGCKIKQPKSCLPLIPQNLVLFHYVMQLLSTCWIKVSSLVTKVRANLAIRRRSLSQYRTSRRSQKFFLCQIRATQRLSSANLTAQKLQKELRSQSTYLAEKDFMCGVTLSHCQFRHLLLCCLHFHSDYRLISGSGEQTGHQSRRLLQWECDNQMW